MGSGASQEVSAKVKDNSLEDLEKLFKALPAEEVEKVLKAAQAAKGGGGPDENSAPFLRKAFTFIAEAFGKIMEAEEKGEEPEEMDEEKCMETYMGYIKQSFEHHDKKKAGKLDKEDAAVFFKNFMQESNLLVDAMLDRKIKMKMALIKKEMEKDIMEGKDEFPNAKDHLPGAVKAAQAEMHKLVLLAKARAKGNAEAFASNKDALTCVAFQGTDDDGDGSLSLEEFLELMDLGSDKFEQLQKLIGADGERTMEGEEVDKCVDAAKEAADIYMRGKLGIKD